MEGAEQANWPPQSIEMSRPDAARIRPDAARMYDHFLGGARNSDADRRAELAVVPQVRDMAWVNRQFLHRAVRYALDQGIRQFLDLGSGIPTVGNVHEIVHAAHPDGHVLYVDADPVVVGHAQALLNDTDASGAIEADLREPAAIFDHDQTRRLIDFDQPVTILLVSVLHFVSGTTDELAAIIGELMRPAAPASLLVISHASPTAAADAIETVTALYGSTSTPLHLRSAQEIRTLFASLDLVTPDPVMVEPAELVPVTRWRPDPGVNEGPPDAADSPFLAGVGRKPEPATATTAHAAGSAVSTTGQPSRPRNDARFPNRPRARRGVPAARP